MSSTEQQKNYNAKSKAGDPKKTQQEEATTTQAVDNPPTEQDVAKKQKSDKLGLFFLHGTRDDIEKTMKTIEPKVEVINQSYLPNDMCAIVEKQLEDLKKNKAAILAQMHAKHEPFEEQRRRLKTFVEHNNNMAQNSNCEEEK